jgi:hypothetical protein
MERVSFLEKNGFPMTIHIETSDYKEKDFNGFYTIIKDDCGNVISDFKHTDLRARIHWANGFFRALRGGEYLPLSIN